MLGGDIFEIVRSGGAVMAPLLVCSVLSLTVVLERAWVLLRAGRSAARLQQSVLAAWAGGGVADARALARLDRSPLAQIYRHALSEETDDLELRDRLARRHHAAAARQLKRGIWLLGTIGSLAPFIGLLGTVFGIVRSFEDMARSGSGGFAVVAAGISEALIATAAGLLVGVLSIFAYNAFMVRIGNLSAEWRDWTDELLTRAAIAAARSDEAVHRGVRSA